jgi:diamine N-acetyltransferase
MTIRLRKVTSKDSTLLLKWWHDEYLIKLTSGIRETSDRVLFGYFKQMLESPKDHHFIIMFEKKPIGHIALSHRNKNTAEIHIIIGEEKYRGRGLGTKSINKAVRFAFDKLGYKRVILEVRPDNLHAIQAYEKNGFVKIRLKKYPGKKQPVTLLMSLNKK